jgi:hypothetical protein
MNYFFISSFFLKFCEAGDIFFKSFLPCSIFPFQVSVFFKYIFKQAFNFFHVELAEPNNFAGQKLFGCKSRSILNDQ